MVKRLPHAALCRSPRPAVFGDFFLYFIKSHPFFLMGERSSFYPLSLLHGSSQLNSCKLLCLLDIAEREEG
jgi:hypothetical protein